MSFNVSRQPLTISELHKMYTQGQTTPEEVLTAIRARAEEYESHNIWIHLLSEDEQAPYLAALKEKSIDDLPLFGIPFAIKDNIDLAAIPTTAACVDYSYTPDDNAFVVDLLLKAGAIPVGKTNLDQFATGLVGTRSPDPWGPCKNAFDEEFISGGSSSGSAVATALGLVCFALGTDTAGSGRVPAAFNNLIGLKPTRGVLSSQGMVAACRTLDTISIFAVTAEDAATVFEIVAAYDCVDSYSRPLMESMWPGTASQKGFSVAVPLPDQLEFFGNEDAARLFVKAKEHFNALGASVIEKDFNVFFEAAGWLYQGPWVAERYAAIEKLITEKPESLHPVIRQIIEPAIANTAVDAFKAEYKMQEFRRLASQFFADIDFAVTPTTGTIYTIAEMLEDPIQLNSNLGYYTNFMNLLDLAGVAIPTGFLSNGLPWGVTAFAPAGADRALMMLAQKYQQVSSLPMGATNSRFQQEEDIPATSSDWIQVVVCGAHLSGFPLNHQLTDRGAKLIKATTSSPNYQFYALAGGPPYRPGMVRVAQGGATIEVEVWAVPAAKFGSFVAGIPAPLGIGKVELADGSWQAGFICESYGLEGATDITATGSWRKYIQSMQRG